MQSRSKNAARNAVSGIINRIVGLLIPFILRTALIKVLGEQYLGLSNLFSSILQVLNLADLGFSTAIIYSMYKPIADGDNDTVCALLNLYKKIYVFIGLFVLVVGLGILPFLDYFIKGDYPPNLNLQVLYLMYLCNTVLSYVFFAHRKTLLTAFQRSDIESNVNSIIQITLDIVKLILLFETRNYYIYIFFIPLTTFISGLITSIISYRMFPEYVCRGSLGKDVTKDIIKNVFALSIQRFGNTISTSLDSIIISSFMGLTFLAIYSNYFYIVSSLMSFIWVCISSATAGIGNQAVTQSVDVNYENFKKINMLNQWTICWCSACLAGLYQHFMKIWVGQSLMSDQILVFCMILYFVIGETRKVVIVYKDATGMWWADKWKPLVGCVLNLVFNVVSVQYIGLKGVILSTIISYLFVELPWETHVLFKHYFRFRESAYYLSLIKYLVVTCLGTFISTCICGVLPDSGVLFLIIKGVICFVSANLFFVLAFRNTNEFKSFLSIFRAAINHRWNVR